MIVPEAAVCPIAKAKVRQAVAGVVHYAPVSAPFPET